jgi:hypothetical protein
MVFGLENTTDIFLVSRKTQLPLTADSLEEYEVSIPSYLDQESIE